MLYVKKKSFLYINIKKSFTPEQQKILEESNVNVEQREKEVIQIARSINELASIFKDLSILVIEQVIFFLLQKNGLFLKGNNFRSN